MKQPFFLFFFYPGTKNKTYIYLLLLLGAFIVLSSPSSMLHMACEVCCYIFFIEKTGLKGIITLMNNKIQIDLLSSKFVVLK